MQFFQMAYTINKQMLKLNGTYWMQQPRVTTVQMAAPMVRAVKDALMRYHSQNGYFPEHVFMYRSGASEGEYKKVSWSNSVRTEIHGFLLRSLITKGALSMGLLKNFMKRAKCRRSLFLRSLSVNAIPTIEWFRRTSMGKKRSNKTANREQFWTKRSFCFFGVIKSNIWGSNCFWIVWLSNIHMVIVILYIIYTVIYLAKAKFTLKNWAHCTWFAVRLNEFCSILIKN